MSGLPGATGQALLTFKMNIPFFLGTMYAWVYVGGRKVFFLTFILSHIPLMCTDKIDQKILYSEQQNLFTLGWRPLQLRDRPPVE
jgi:hypothetical protein